MLAQSSGKSPNARLLRHCLLILLAVGSTDLLSVSAVERGSEQQQALRKRVEEFYSLLQIGRWSQAEAYLTEESREPFRDEQKKAFLGFEVVSLELKSDGKTATVVVKVHFIMPPSPQPLAVPRSTEWRLVEGEWYLDYHEPDPFATQALFSGERPAPPSEDLKFEGHHYHLGMVYQQDRKVARFPFTNVTDHVVTIQKVDTRLECLQLRTEKMRYEPGESGTLEIEFDPTGYKYYFAQTVFVNTEPGNHQIRLMVSADVVPDRPQPSQKANPKTSP